MDQKHVERFWGKVNKTESCWLWTGGDNGTTGHGKFHVWPKTYNAHRVAWELAYGPVPEGKCVLHACDNPPCVRAEHLFLGTQAENVADCVAKGRNYKGPKPWVLKAEKHPAYRNPYHAPHRKLEAEDVVALRAERESGSTYKALAEKYGIVRSTVERIVKRKTWVTT